VSTATKLQVGAGVGTRACAFVICVRLYKITRLRPSSNEASKGQRWRVAIYELLLILLLPVMIMAILIIVQPVRFEIYQEEGCVVPLYSYIAYILYYGPALVLNIGCAILAPLTLRAFFRHRKEMDEYFTTRGREDSEITRTKYKRLMIIACLDTMFNLPILIAAVVMSGLAGDDSALNQPYTSWRNVHDGAGGNLPGTSLSTILQTLASTWSSGEIWNVFALKWDEWINVLHAVFFFGVFGTTPEMRRYYWSALWFLPERCGYKRRRVSDIETISDMSFNSNLGQGTQNHPAGDMRRGSLASLEAEVKTSGSCSMGFAEMSDLEA